MDRRDFLKLGGSAIAAGAVATRETRATAQGQAQSATAAAPFAAKPIETVRLAYVGIGGQGSSHVRNLLKIPGCRITAVCDIRAERTDWATKAITGSRPSGARGLQQGAARFRAALRDRGSRSRLQRDAVGMARADHAGGDEERQAHRHGSAGGDDDRRLLGDGRSPPRSSGSTA